ncbi:MAG: hypothetical protein H6664_04355 [Ardenticatenaceae bacterium]|nr:hypothetical protein [Ardenticatenaceae bacterium]
MRPVIKQWVMVMRRGWTAVSPGKTAWRGAAAGLTLTAFAFLLVYTYALFAPFSGLAFALALLALPLLAALGGGLALLALAWLRRWPQVMIWALVVTAVFLGTTFVGYDLPALATIAAWVGVMGMLAGAGTVVLWRGKWREETAVHHTITLVGLLVGWAGLLGGVAWLLWPGPPLPMLAIAAQQGGPVSPLDLPDPSQPGPYAVLTLTYGGGDDHHRPEFGAEADLLTTSVNGDPFVSGWTDLRTRYWGIWRDGDAAERPCHNPARPHPC